MNKKTIIATIIIITVVSAYFLFSSLRGESWIGFYYPDSFDLTDYVQSPELESIEECRFWVDSQINIHNPDGSGYDYECGKNCRFDGVYICEATIR